MTLDLINFGAKNQYFSSLLGGRYTLSSTSYQLPTYTFSNLNSQVVGHAVGEGANSQITLDLNAAGHGWFIDSTADTNEEFLPTSNPNVWQAKAGSAADGKMDMLSVLLHEYGHALGRVHTNCAGQLFEQKLPDATDR